MECLRWSLQGTCRTGAPSLRVCFAWRWSVNVFTLTLDSGRRWPAFCGGVSVEDGIRGSVFVGSGYSMCIAVSVDVTAGEVR